MIYTGVIADLNLSRFSSFGVYNSIYKLLDTTTKFDVAGKNYIDFVAFCGIPLFNIAILLFNSMESTSGTV